MLANIGGFLYRRRIGKQYSTQHSARPVASSPSLPVDADKVALQQSVISTQAANGKEIMGPEILLWRYPEQNLVNASLLTVAGNQFCVLQVYGRILAVYETGQHRVPTPDDASFGSVQLTFNGEPIPLEYEALYINRAPLVIKASGVARSHDMAEIDYSVDYAIQVATREDVVQLVQYISHRNHPLRQAQTLYIGDINAYVEPVIEQTVNHLLRITPPQSVELGLAPDQRLQIDKNEQLMHELIQQSLSIYGITVTEVKVQVAPRDEHVGTLNRCADEIAALEAELESIRVDFGLRIDALSVRLNEILKQEGDNGTV